MEKGYEGLFTAIFGELPIGIYPYILEEGGREVPLAEALKEALDKLPLAKTRNRPNQWPRMRRVLELRFGLLEGESETLRQAGETLGIKHHGQVGAIQAKALRVLRHPSYSRRLRQFIIPSPRSIAELRARLARFEQLVEERQQTIADLEDDKARLLQGKPLLTPEQQRLERTPLEEAFQMLSENLPGLLRVQNALHRGRIRTVSDLRKLVESGEASRLTSIGEKGTQICNRALELLDQQAQSR